MDSIKQLLNTIVENGKVKHNILGTGCYGIVWDFGEDVYKLSNEISYQTATQNMAKINELNSKGVNIPKFKAIDCFYATTNSVVANIKSFANNIDKQDFAKVVSDFASGFGDNLGKYEFVGSRQTKIVGDDCFADAKRNVIIEVNHLSKTLPKLWPNLQKTLNCQLENNLDYFNKIPAEHYVKFIQDAFLIQKNNLVIDNINGSNFIYNRKTGFNFIDVGGMTNIKLEGAGLFECTVENVCNMISANYNSNREIVNKQFALLEKLNISLRKACENPEIYAKYKEYISKPNLLIELNNKVCSAYVENQDSQSTEAISEVLGLANF